MILRQSRAPTKNQSFQHNHSPIFRGLWALALSAVFLLASCDEPSSAAKPQIIQPKINQAQAFEAVGKARQALQAATDSEAEKQAAYLQAKSQSQPQEGINKAKTDWETAKQQVADAEGRVQAAIQTV